MMTCLCVLAAHAQTVGGQGFHLNFQMNGVTMLELESVDGYALSVDGNSLFTYMPEGGFTSGKDYYIETQPCDVYGGYRLSIYKDGLVAHYFGVHQTIEAGQYITPIDLLESELEFGEPRCSSGGRGTARTGQQDAIYEISGERGCTSASGIA